MAVDSNIIIYLLNGDRTVEAMLEGNRIFLSFINKIELLGFQNLSPRQQSLIRDIVQNTTVIHSNDRITEEAIKIRATYKVKSPDAIVVATSMYLGIPLLTADASLFKIKEAEIIQYRL